MITNKSVNKLFLATILVYVSAMFILPYILPQNFSIYISMLISQGLILIPIFVYSKIKKLSIKEIIPFRKIKFSVIVLIIICTYLFQPLLTVVNMFSLFFTTSAVTEMTQNIEQNILLNGLMIAVLPAIVEEMMFRGIIFQTYRKQKILAGTILSAFLFGCMHMNFNQFAYTLVFGIYLALLVEATDSIYSSIIAHFVVNFNGVILVHLSNKLSSISNSENTDVLEINGNFLKTMDSNMLFSMITVFVIIGIIAIITTAGAIGIFIAIVKLSGRTENVKQMFKKRSKERLITIPLTIGIIIAFAIMIFLQYMSGIAR